MEKDGLSTTRPCRATRGSDDSEGPRFDPALALALTGRSGGAEPPAAAPHLAALRQAIKLEANRRFGENCGTVEFPDKAFLPLDVTGDGGAELIAFFGQATAPPAVGRPASPERAADHPVLVGRGRGPRDACRRDDAWIHAEK